MRLARLAGADVWCDRRFWPEDLRMHLRSRNLSRLHASPEVGQKGRRPTHIEISFYRHPERIQQIGGQAAGRVEVSTEHVVRARLAVADAGMRAR